MNKRSINRFGGWLLLVLLALAGPAQPLMASSLRQDQTARRTADALMAEGTLLFQQQEWGAALTKLEAACPLYQQSNAQPEEARCWQAVAQTRLKLDDPEGALTAYQTSVELWQALGDHFWEVVTLSQIGDILRHTNQYDAAEQVYEQLPPLVDKVLTDANRPLLAEEKAGLANIYNNMALFYSITGQYAVAFDLYEQALAIHAEVDNYGAIAATLDNQGTIFAKLGYYRQALDLYDLALRFAQQLYDAGLGDAEAVLSILGNMGVAYAGQGNFQQALKFHQQALDLAHQINDREGEEATLINQGLAFNALGQTQEAWAAFDQALSIAETIDDRQGKAAALNNLADLNAKAKEHEIALALYQQALAVAEQAHDQRGTGIAHSNIGQTLMALQQYDEALEHFAQALKIARQPQPLGNREAEAVALNNLGHVYYARKSYSQALDLFQQALKLAQQHGLRLNEGVAQSNIAQVQKALGQHRAAIVSLQKAITAFESIQSQLTIEALLAGYAAQQTTAYQRLVTWLWEDKKYSDAFDYAERARAQAFLNQLRGQGIDLYAETSSPLIQEARALLRKITGFQIERAAASAQQPQDRALLTALTADITQAQTEYAALLTRIQIAAPEDATLLTIDDPIPLPQLRNQVLDAQTTLVEYFVTDEQTFAWVVDRQGSHMAKLPISADKLRTEIDKLLNSVGNTQETNAVASALYAVLVAPLTAYLGQPNLLIVPHGPLHYLPFAALWNEETARYLIQEYTLTFAPSASALPLIYAKRNPNQGQLLALGNPTDDLVDSEGEVKAIAGMYGTQPLLRKAATEGQIYANAGQVDLLHLSAHGALNEYNPLFSAIELAADEGQDGRLEVHEIYGLNLVGVNLVTLSACETALGQQSDGDELIGLTRAFLYAGAPSVVTTLWSVRSDTTEELMVSFYTHLRKGETAAVALQQAQIEMLSEHSPYYWAAFTLTGDYRGGNEP
ncbi:MAG: CHAT domain-containing protein [Caldilinea sp. CFX5]|nr:CHAT domain-containing protein [Caldilinea sp. CFX5]